MNIIVNQVSTYTILIVVITQIFILQTYAIVEPNINVYIQENRFGEAFKTLNNSLYDDENVINPIILRQILELENLATDTNALLLHAIELVNYAQKNKDLYNQMIGYYYLGSVYYQLYDDNKAIENFGKMLRIAQDNDYILGKGLYYMFNGLIYSSYEDYDLALENFEKAKPYFDEAELDNYWIFPNFKKENEFNINIISIILTDSDDKVAKIVDLSDIYKNENWAMRLAVTSKCGYELNKNGGYKEAIVLLKECKNLIGKADFTDMFNKFGKYMNFDLSYAYYNTGDYKLSSQILLEGAYESNIKLEVERGELINQRLREIDTNEIKRQSESKTRIIIFISFLLLFFAITIALIIRQYKISNRLSRELYERSIRDSMTGLYNKTEIIKIYESNINKKISLAVLDIDEFKNINDTYGHSMGDIVIKDIATIISNVVGKSGDVGRYGGEEFLVVLYKENNIDSIAILEEIRKKIESKIWPFKDTPITISIGLLINSQNTSFSNGFKAADQLLYLAKSKGKNIICHI